MHRPRCCAHGNFVMLCVGLLHSIRVCRILYMYIQSGRTMLITGKEVGTGGTLDGKGCRRSLRSSPGDGAAMGASGRYRAGDATARKEGVSGDGPREDRAGYFHQARQYGRGGTRVSLVLPPKPHIKIPG